VRVPRQLIVEKDSVAICEPIACGKQTLLLLQRPVPSKIPTGVSPHPKHYSGSCGRPAGPVAHKSAWRQVLELARSRYIRVKRTSKKTPLGEAIFQLACSLSRSLAHLNKATPIATNILPSLVGTWRN